jgi:hypothetical protein
MDEEYVLMKSVDVITFGSGEKSDNCCAPALLVQITVNYSTEIGLMPDSSN